MSIEALAQTYDSDIVWLRRDEVTAAKARHWVADECGDGDLSVWKVGRCHLRQLGPGDCPLHPEGEVDARSDHDDCRCYEIDEGWWEECSHRTPDAVPAWRVEAI